MSIHLMKKLEDLNNKGIRMSPEQSEHALLLLLRTKRESILFFLAKNAQHNMLRQAPSPISL
jgi:hypothetical protein